MERLLPLVLLVAAAALVAGDTCRGAADASTARHGEARSWLTNGFNQAYGITYGTDNLTFADPSLAAAMRAVGVGALRYPGGTQSNYFNWTDGRVAPHHHHHLQLGGGGGAYDHGAYDHGAYNLAQFHRHVGRRLASPRCVSYVLNVLSMNTTAQMVALVDTLVRVVGRDGIAHIEIGNEVYDTRSFDHDVAAYIGRVTGVVRHIRRVLPHAKLSCPLGPVGKDGKRHGDFTAWNAALAPYVNGSRVATRGVAPLFDAVVHHDYTLGSPKAVTTPSEVSEVVSWGIGAMRNVTGYVGAVFGADVPVWVTEFDWFKAFDPALHRTMTQPMLILAYLAGAVCSAASRAAATARVEVMLLHFLWCQVDVPLIPNVVRLPERRDAPGLTQYDIAAQVYSHVWDLGVRPFDTVSCLRAGGAACGQAPHLPTGSPCVHGLWFNNATAADAAERWTALVLNVCPGDVSVALPVGGGGGGGGARNATVFRYGGFKTGFGMRDVQGCTGPLWRLRGDGCGAMPMPTESRVGVENGAVTFQAGGLRLLVVTTLSPDHMP
jgi:hypothetical protein